MSNSRRLPIIVALIATAALWAMPSALFVPVITGRDTTTMRLSSCLFTFALGMLIASLSSFWITRMNPEVMKFLGIGLVVGSVALVGLYLLMQSKGILQGLGGDRGQALDIALERIFQGKYPYAALTYDGGQITPMPGGLLLALPAKVVTGNSGYMTIYIVPIAIALLARFGRRVWVVSAVAILFAPAFWADTLSNGDLVTTSFLVFVIAAVTVQAAFRSRGFSRYLWPVALGVVASTRMTSIIVAIFAMLIVFASGRIRIGVLQSLITLMTFAVVTLPLYFLNPDEFSPLHTSSFIQGSLGILMAVVIMLLLMTGLFISSSVRRHSKLWQLVFVSSLMSAGLGAIPFIVDPSDKTLFFSGYAVLTLTAPLLVLKWRELGTTAVNT